MWTASRESFDFCNSEGVRQRLEKEDKDTNDLCEQHDSYEFKWDGEHDTEEYNKKSKTNPKMNKEDGVISQPLEATTEMISEHLESTVDVDDVENILNLTKESIHFSKERRKNTTVISSSRKSIDTEEMDILNDSDYIKNLKMNEEDGVTTEMIYEHRNSKVEVDDVENMFESNKKKTIIYQKIVERTPRLYPLAEIVF